MGSLLVALALGVSAASAAHPTLLVGGTPVKAQKSAGKVVKARWRRSLGKRSPVLVSLALVIRVQKLRGAM
jgi:hypothetical protein